MNQVARFVAAVGSALALTAVLAGTAVGSPPYAPAPASHRLQPHHGSHHGKPVKRRPPAPKIGPGGDNDPDNHGAPSDGDGGI